MKFFKLPDLGEGLFEAEIISWHVQPGQKVVTDQLLVSVETDKAIVDIPSPCEGIIAHLFGGAGDLVHIGEPLVEFVGGEEADQGTVVGKIEQETVERVDQFIIGAPKSNTYNAGVKTTPAIRSLAHRMNIDINRVTGSGRDGLITSADLERVERLTQQLGASKPVRGVRRTMAKKMAESHEQVVPVTLFDDVDIFAWGQGKSKSLQRDPTMRLILAMASACKQEIILNSYFDGQSMSHRMCEVIDLGIAVDTPDGLFVPVLRDIGNRDIKDMYEGLTRLKQDVTSRRIPPEELRGATITLSNFGMIAGRYGTPVVMPPMVAILGAGRIRDEVVVAEGNPAVHPVMPISLTFDHRAITGAEAARFLGVIRDVLSLRQHLPK